MTKSEIYTGLIVSVIYSYTSGEIEINDCVEMLREVFCQMEPREPYSAREVYYNGNS